MKSIFNFLRFVVIIALFTLSSCTKDNNIDPISNNKCNVSDPIEELGWLKKAIDDTKEDKYSYYAMSVYKGETVFYYGNCNPVVNYISVLRNCSGENIGYLNDFQDKLTGITILWKHANSKCNFEE